MSWAAVVVQRQVDGRGIGNQVGGDLGAAADGLRFVLEVGPPVVLEVAAHAIIEAERVVENEVLVVEQVHDARRRARSDEDSRTGGMVLDAEPGVEWDGEDAPLLELE